MSGEVERLRRWFAAESREAALARRAGRAAPIEGPGQSYIGGLPRLPAHMAWPEADVGNQRLPLHFAAQIDLQDLPDVADRHLLPDAGILFFFMHEVCMSDPGAPFPSRVLFHPKSARFPERAPPSDLPTFWAGYGYRDWLGAGHPRRSVDFRYPITFKAVRTYFSHYWDDGEPASELYEELAAHALSEALGPPPPASYYGDGPRRGEEAWDILADASWPFVWGIIAHHAALPTERSQGAWIEIASPEFRAFAQKLHESGQRWLERAHSARELEPVHAADAADYRAWVSAARRQELGIWSKLASSIRRMSLFYANRCCEAGMERLAPARWLDQLNELASWVDRSHDGSKSYSSALFEMHQVLGRWKHEHSAVMEESRSDEVLLLQIDGSYVLPYLPSPEGLFHYTISRADLAARDFSRVQLFA